MASTLDFARIYRKVDEAITTFENMSKWWIQEIPTNLVDARRNLIRTPCFVLVSRLSMDRGPRFLPLSVSKYIPDSVDS